MIHWLLKTQIGGHVLLWYSTIIYLSRIKLRDGQKNVLCKGIDFSVPWKTLSEQVKAGFKHCWQQLQDKTAVSGEWPKEYRPMLTTIGHKFANSPLDKTGFLLDKEHLAALNEICYNADTITKFDKFDKGNGVGVLDCSDYDRKMGLFSFGISLNELVRLCNMELPCNRGMLSRPFYWGSTKQDTSIRKGIQGFNLQSHATLRCIAYQKHTSRVYPLDKFCWWQMLHSMSANLPSGWPWFLTILGRWYSNTGSTPSRMHLTFLKVLKCLLLSSTSMAATCAHLMFLVCLLTFRLTRPCELASTRTEVHWLLNCPCLRNCFGSCLLTLLQRLNLVLIAIYASRSMEWQWVTYWAGVGQHLRVLWEQGSWRSVIFLL